MITTYSELQTAVASWLHRTDLSAVIPDFIRFAETKLSADLNSRAMEAIATLTCTVGSRFVTLPSDLVEMKRAMLVDNPISVLEYKSPDQLAQDNPYLLSTGKPVCFSISGAQIELSPTPDSAYPLEILYQQRIPTLGGSVTTNWLLAQEPNAYLYGALVASVDYTLEDARLPLWERKYQQAVDSINNVEWYSGTTMRVKAR